ncbi:M42 family metallopeptidase [Ferroacidibacillus organovorans]|uniref:Peptidase M42 n=1 Tax=Ferroacidibacillus organovorans TaxID=1765683 RepID=A0A1V4ESJ1_9BACL|nr:M42 family metallopeptidase [Ferroacidibacillus organovorans]OPG15810.1 peptidase M42 [Ferroacidibacillus organovorans]
MRETEWNETQLEEALESAVNHIIRLVSIPSPTGFTDQAIHYCAERFGMLGVSYKRTYKGGLQILIPGKSQKTRVLAAHVDTLGGMVREITDQGYLRLSALGGYAFQTVEGVYCKIHTLDGAVYTGTLVARHASTHVYKEVEERTPDTVVLRLDEKVQSKVDVEALGIAVGDFVSYDPRVVVTTSGYLKSRHLDDKASVGILLSLVERTLANSIELPYSLCLLISTDEEIGYGGNSNIPEEAFEYVAVDMGAIGEGLTTTEHVVSICAKDSSGPYDYQLRKKLTHLAKTHQIPHAVDLYPYYSSDASAARRAGYDLATGLIGPGIDSSHAYERTHRDAISATLRLLWQYIQSV